MKWEKGSPGLVKQHLRSFWQDLYPQSPLLYKEKTKRQQSYVKQETKIKKEVHSWQNRYWNWLCSLHFPWHENEIVQSPQRLSLEVILTVAINQTIMVGLEISNQKNMKFFIISFWHTHTQCLKKHYFFVSNFFLPETMLSNNYK